MNNKKLRQQLRAAFGKIPDPYYQDGDMGYIRAYFDYRREHELDEFLIDEITWNDLDMERLFKRINPKRCTSGEQYLYYMLRSPALDSEEYERRKKLIEYAGKDPERRLDIETILARMGCSRRADLCRAFDPETHGAGRLAFYLGCLSLMIAAVVVALLHIRFGALLVFAAVLLNCYVHEFGKRRSQRDYDTVNYVVNMIFALRRLQKLRDPALDVQLQAAYESLERLRAVIRSGGISTGMDSGGVEDAILTITLLDLITYEYLKNKLGRCHDDVLKIHEALGSVDAAISIASYRASLEEYTVPELLFSSDHPPFLSAADLRHPLLSEAVSNDCFTERPILITGSNASGKSTYLKTVALAAILSQSICTVPASSYKATAFRVYSSMALNDSLENGESYYIAETRSLKRIMDAVAAHPNVLCVIDEVLRGTNTIERIAAASAVLEALADRGALCIAATHDLELCDLLQNVYRMFHFEEQIENDQIVFDYTLLEGRAVSRNAIKLLRIMGYDSDVIQRANDRADRFLNSGIWQ